MKLATLKDRTRDGMLVVVSRDLTRSVSARPIAATLQAALDDWDHVAPRLADLAHGLELGALPADRFHEHDAMAPLPRAYQWLNADGEGDPTARLAQRGSDGFLAPRAPIPAGETAHGLDVEAGLAVIVGDVAAGADRAAAAAAIRLVMLVGDRRLAGLAATGPVGTRPGATFSPVAVTPDELGEAWNDGRIALPFHLALDGRPVGRRDAAAEPVVDLPALVAAAARTRALGAGTIIGAGLASLRRLRAAEGGVDAGLAVGETVRIAMKGRDGHSLFGAIEQTIEPPAAPEAEPADG